MDTTLISSIRQLKTLTSSGRVKAELEMAALELEQNHPSRASQSLDVAAMDARGRVRSQCQEWAAHLRTQAR